MNLATKRRYQSRDHKQYREVNSLLGKFRRGRVFHHVLNLFEAHRWEREHPRAIVPTTRYREWLAKRDA